ncbi:MAG TPA: nucleotidyl transferase AbiEii/AbiGii toxin family protein [Bryobacteraceae bacterium]|nr:nucleotidyl transferase AbiEii/AbiGii toxin family protein [Bryobacteraceae bacterium]
MEDLAQLHLVAGQFSADVAIIGAAALLCFVDIGRFTRDIDLAVGLDLEDFTAFANELRAAGWTQEGRNEHRWRGPSGSIIDLLPAGPALRQAKRITWPESGFEMSLAGFEHVFARALPFSFAEGVQYRVAPPPVVGLLKIIAFMDDQHGRKKDLLDVTELFRCYEAASDRIFGDEVFAAELEDIAYSNALLLGMDVGSMATDEEFEILSAFFQTQRISDEELLELDREDMRQLEAYRFQQQLRAFRKGIEQSRSR